MASSGVLQMMDWEVCVICGDGGGVLKCPGDSKKRRMELTSTEIFCSLSKDFKTCKSLPAQVNFLVNNHPKSSRLWHKSCDPKLAPSKLKILLGNSSQVKMRGGPRKLREARTKKPESHLELT